MDASVNWWLGECRLTGVRTLAASPSPLTAAPSPCHAMSECRSHGQAGGRCPSVPPPPPPPGKGAESATLDGRRE